MVEKVTGETTLRYGDKREQRGSEGSDGLML